MRSVTGETTIVKGQGNAVAGDRPRSTTRRANSSDSRTASLGSHYGMNERAVADVASGSPSNRPHTGHHQHVTTAVPTATIRSACDNLLVADLKRGEVLGLIGPNGAGKTTLFECLAGVLPMDAGGIRVNGRPLTSRERAALVFYLPDGIAPWSSQPVDWALDFMIGLFGGDPSLRSDVVAQLDLRPLLDRPIGLLSKGQRKRALLAMGLLTPQPVLLADEPFDGLDLRQTRDVATTLRAHASRGRTLFLSIHQIADAARLRPVRLAQRRTRLRRRDARRAGRARGGAREPPVSGSRRGVSCPYVGRRFSGCSRRNGASWCRRVRGGSCSWQWGHWWACRSSAPCAPMARRVA